MNKEVKGGGGESKSSKGGSSRLEDLDWGSVLKQQALLLFSSDIP